MSAELDTIMQLNPYAFLDGRFGVPWMINDNGPASSAARTTAAPTFVDA